MEKNAAKTRQESTVYIENLCNNRTEVMRKIHKINYGNLFTNDFDIRQIDGKLDSLQIDEQLRLLDHVVDYVYVNFPNL